MKQVCRNCKIEYDDNDHGTNKDGSICPGLCSYCFYQGEYTTLGLFLKKVDKIRESQHIHKTNE